MGRIQQRAALECLRRDRLAELAEAFELGAGPRASRGELMELLSHSRRASYERILQALRRDELKAICAEFDRDSSKPLTRRAQQPQHARPVRPLPTTVAFCSDQGHHAAPTR